jgi:hypothetical protein
MIRPSVAAVAVLVFTFLSSRPIAHAGQPDVTPVLALWEFDGWAKPTPERPLGLRFLLLGDGRVVFSPDEPAIDVVIPNAYYQAQLSPAESKALTDSMIGILQQQANAAANRERGWTAIYFRDAETGQQRRAEVSGHPCLASGRVFSATAAVSGLQAVRNSDDRTALTPLMRTVCDTLAGFHHRTAEPWMPGDVPAPLPER